MFQLQYTNNEVDIEDLKKKKEISKHFHEKKEEKKSYPQFRLRGRKQQQLSWQIVFLKLWKLKQKILDAWQSKKSPKVI